MQDRHPSSEMPQTARDAGRFRAPAAGANIPGSDRDRKGVAAAEVRPLDLEPGLVQRAKEGDRDAFGQLYRLHHAGLTRMARFHLGPDHEDAVSDVFVRAWAALPRHRDTGAPFAAWLYGIARHVVADEIARRIRTQPVAETPDAGLAFHEDDRLALAEALDRIPDEQRQVIELKFLVGMRNPEVAAALGTSVGAVNAKQWRAIRALRLLLESP
jgi:RNA polymerase sigma-70 factor (ECF subfamily)